MGKLATERAGVKAAGFCGYLGLVLHRAERRVGLVIGF